MHPTQFFENCYLFHGSPLYSRNLFELLGRVLLYHPFDHSDVSQVPSGLREITSTLRNIMLNSLASFCSRLQHCETAPSEYTTRRRCYCIHALYLINRRGKAGLRFKRTKAPSSSGCPGELRYLDLSVNSRSLCL